MSNSDVFYVNMDSPPKFESRLFLDIEDPVFRLCRGDGTVLVAIHLSDGAIEYGSDYTPDEAARVFWEAIRRHGEPPMNKKWKVD